MDLSDIGSGPDMTSFDRTKLDFGNEVPEDEPKVEPAEEPAEDPKAEDPPAEDEGVEDEPKAEDKPARDEKGKFTGGIPKARFDEAVGKEREAREAAERRAADLEARLAAKEQAGQVAEKDAVVEELNTLETKVSELETKHAQLLLDGDVEKATAVMKEIRHTERQITRIELRGETQQATAQVLEKERMDVTIARLESDYPEMNPKSASYSQTLVRMALALQPVLMREENLSPSKALEKAVSDVIAEFKPQRGDEEKVDEKGLEAAKIAAERKSAQVKKNIDTLGKQPASTKDVGLDSDKLGEKKIPSIAQMTQEEYAALPESTKARLRGDLL